MTRVAYAASLALALAGLLALPAAPSRAQTVADYEAALAAAPVADAAPAIAAQYCRPLLNYVFTSLEPGELKMPWLLGALPFDSATDPVIAQKRALCMEVYGQPVIAFNQTSREQIVTPVERDPGDRGPAKPLQ